MCQYSPFVSLYSPRDHNENKSYLDLHYAIPASSIGNRSTRTFYNSQILDGFLATLILDGFLASLILDGFLATLIFDGFLGTLIVEGFGDFNFGAGFDCGGSSASFQSFLIYCKLCLEGC